MKLGGYSSQIEDGVGGVKRGVLEKV